MAKNKPKSKVVMFGIGCLTLLEIVALFNGINRQLFTIVIALIAGAIGVSLPTPKVFK